MMEEVQEQKFVCKFCNKSCFSGKSLGGHMRGHLALISAAKKNKVKADSNNPSNMDCENGAPDHGDCGIEENSKNGCKVSAEQSNSTLIQEKIEDRNINLGSDDQDSHGLRENPKKSWKISDLRTSRAPAIANLCKECGRRFPSSRALAGHMRTHSMKGKNRHLCKKCNKGFDSMRALYGHMKSHSKRSRVSPESADGLSEFDIDYPRKKRSVIRYKSTPNLSFSSANASSSVNEVEEVEDVAVCLMMLSRGVRNWYESNSPLESTDNAVESKSFTQSKELSKIPADDSECEADEVDEEKNPVEKLDSCTSGSANTVSEQGLSEINQFDSEFASDNAKKAEMEVSVDELPLSEMFKKPRRVDVSAIQLENNKITRATDATQVEPAKDLIMVFGIDQDDSELLDSDPGKKVILLAHDPLLEGKSSDMLKFADIVSEKFKDSRKKREYKCRTCDKIFSSHQALGGHRNRHKIISCSSALSTETSLLSDNEYNYTPIEQESAGMAMTGFELTKSKEHQCPLCFKVFSTGQALGGHKRAHYAGFTESKTKENTVENHELHDIEKIFDLNLAVTPHQEARGDDTGLKLWWAGHGHEREPLVISN